MAINTTNTVNSLAGDGTTTAIPITFVFFGADELEVIERDDATGAETAKALTTHYTVGGGNGATGTVTALIAPAVGKSWFVRRKTKRLQSTVYSEGDPFPAKTHERALDRGLAISQEIEEKIGRALQFPKTETAAPSLPPIAQLLGKFFYMTAGGEIVGLGLGDIGAVALPLGIDQGGTGATDAAAARTALGLGAAATRAVGTAVGNLIEVLAGGKLPALDGSLLTGIVTGAATLGTYKATTSGAAHDFTGIPSNAKAFLISLNGVSTNGTGAVGIQLGKSAGIETTGYLGTQVDTTGAGASNFSSGFFDGTAGAAVVRHGIYIFVLVDASTNTWAMIAILGFSNSAAGRWMGGTKALAGTLDRARLTTTNGTDLFDAGGANILVFT